METDVFEVRLRGAVRASWWTLLIAAEWLTVWWLLWLLVQGSPGLMDWLKTLWGGVGVEDVRHFVVVFFGVLKMALFLLVLAAVFLTLWLRELRRAG